MDAAARRAAILSRLEQTDHPVSAAAQTKPRGPGDRLCRPVTISRTPVVPAGREGGSSAVTTEKNTTKPQMDKIAWAEVATA